MADKDFETFNFDDHTVDEILRHLESPEAYATLVTPPAHRLDRETIAALDRLREGLSLLGRPVDRHEWHNYGRVNDDDSTIYHLR